MAVNKRAAMRREKRVQEKLTGGKPTQTKLMARAYITGKNEGFELLPELCFLHFAKNLDLETKESIGLLNVYPMNH